MRSALLFGLLSLWIPAMRVEAQSDEAVLGERGFPDNHEVRSELADTVRAPAFEAELVPASLHVEKATGLVVKFSIITEGGGLYLLFINQWRGSFAIENAGSWVIKRSAIDGSFLQAKVFLNGDPGSFMRLFPDHERTRMDLFLFGYPVYRNVIVPIDFSQLLTEPVMRIMDATSESVRWNLMLPRPHLPEDRLVERMAEAAQSGAAGGSVGAAPTSIAPRPPAHLRCDVQSVPFLHFVSERGYLVHQLTLLLYLLATEDPGNFYLGFLSPPPPSGGPSGSAAGDKSAAGAARSDGANAAHPARAADVGDGPGVGRSGGGEAIADAPATASPIDLFPYFDQEGVFRVVAVDQGRLVDLERVVRERADDYICLERIRAERNLVHP